MPISLRRDESHRWLRARVSGNLTLDELLKFLRTARSSDELRMWPLLVDASTGSTTMTDSDVTRAVEVVAHVAASGPRAHVAIVTGDDRLYRWMLNYETKCAEAGIRIIRVFRDLADADRWLDIVSAARNLQ